MRPALLLLALALLPGCAVLQRLAPSDESAPYALLARADALARNHPEEARGVYRKVLHGSRGTPAAADALYGLGQLYVDPDSPLHDWGAASIAFGRLVGEYPESRHAAEARAWRAALTELLRNQADARRLRTDLDRLKELDMEQEE